MTYTKIVLAFTLMLLTLTVGIAATVHYVSRDSRPSCKAYPVTVEQPYPANSACERLLERRAGS